ncbi:MAG TPA: competence/damage-inducible protein A [Gemmatimonadales bacterium]|jgi:nicotinamide-nucleotide amidase
MKIELLTIGTELLLGHLVDTNGAELGRALADAGIAVVRRTSVPDEPTAIQEAARLALERTGAFLATGGLGPTADDVTKKVVADLFGMPLDFHPEIWDALVARFARFGRTPVEKNRSQAEVPRGATVLPNRWGTAPGLWLEGPPGLAILLPGVPGEMRALLQHEVLPRLADRAENQVVRSRMIRTTGIPESTLAERIGPIEAELAPLTLAYLPRLEGVDLRLTAWGVAPAEADDRLQAGLERLRARAGPWAYGEDDTDLAAVVLARARERALTLATAESCTGGVVGARLTEIPGSSEVFVGGVIAYDNRIKLEMLGVPAALLEEHGAVSEPVARAMAEGAARRFGTALSVAVTGIAGPSGGSADKPVGLVHLAAGHPGGITTVRQVFPGSRAEIRGRAAQAALFLLFRALTQDPT